MSYRTEIEQIDTKSGDEYSVLRIFHGDEMIESYDDAGSCEDRTLDRNYAWIEKELKRAYDLGKHDALHPLTLSELRDTLEEIKSLIKGESNDRT